MKQQNCGPHLGKLVYQIPGVVNLAYDLSLAIIIPRLEDIEEEDENKLAHYFGTFLVSLFSLKTSFRPSKQLRNFRTQKELPKIVSCATIKEIEKKQQWWSKWNRQVATNIHMD